MWGRIANITEQLDANFGSGGGDARAEDYSRSATPDDDGAYDGVDAPAHAEGNGGDDDDDVDGGSQDGWGDDEDFEDELDFGSDDFGGDEFADGDGDEGVAPEGEPAEKEETLDEEPVLVNGTSVAYSDDAGDLDGSNVERDGGGNKVGDEAQPVAASAVAGRDRPPAPPQSQPQSPPQAYEPPSIVTVSAPGKALIAGGYLVLESPNPGVVLAAEGCRFHATVAFRPPHSNPVGAGATVVGNSVDASWESIPLDVYSPQFDKVLSYYLSYPVASGVAPGHDGGVSLRLQPRIGPHEPNKFVERSLLLTLGYLRQSLGGHEFRERLRRHGQGERVALAVKLRADNDFYSQINRLKERGWDLTPRNLERLDAFLPCPKNASTGELIVNKTGMGSSAALVTSIVGALLRFFGVASLPSRPGGEGDNANGTSSGFGDDKEGLRIAHNLSQICHCHAQGKVGSGFDVSSAVYGSHIYTRFSKGVIKDFLDGLAEPSGSEEDDGLQITQSLLEQLVTLVDDVEWDCTITPISLPPGLELLMADVCGGSESPSMARKILEWKKQKRKVGFMDDYYWKDLKRCNKKIVSLLTQQFTTETFLDGLRRDGAMIISTRTAEQWKKPMPSSWHKFEGSSWDVALQLLDMRMAFLECRQNLKGMGEAAGVPVEPDEQSTLADATMKLPGVVAAGVPGAGGYDALYVIYVKGEETDDGKSDRVRDEIGNLWKKMSDTNDGTTVCPLSVRAAASGGGLVATSLDW